MTFSICNRCRLTDSSYRIHTHQCEDTDDDDTSLDTYHGS